MPTVDNHILTDLIPDPDTVRWRHGAVARRRKEKRQPIADADSSPHFSLHRLSILAAFGS
jgi:hypothetical protein